MAAPSSALDPEALTPVSPTGHTGIPVELDSQPVTEHEPAQAADGDDEDESMEPMSKEVEGGAGWQRAEEREKQHEEKSRDPAILVNIPKGPAAQDYEVAAHAGGRPAGETGELTASEASGKASAES